MKKSLPLQLLAPFKGQDGMVIVIGLMLLVVLTLMSTAAIDMGIVEQTIAKNNEVDQSNFYAAESVCIEGTSELEKISDDDLYNKVFPGWLVESFGHIDDPASVDGTTLDFADNTNWVTTNPDITPEDTNLALLQPAGFDANDRMKFVAVDAKVVGSLSDSSKKTHVYSVYSIYDVNGPGKSYRGRKLLNIGYVRVVYTP